VVSPSTAFLRQHCSAVSVILRRSQWPRGLRRGFVTARLRGVWFRIPPGAWMSACCDCVLSGRGLCDWLITRLEESYRVWCVVSPGVCGGNHPLHQVSRLKKDQRYTSAAPLRLHGRLYGEFYPTGSPFNPGLKRPEREVGPLHLVPRVRMLGVITPLPHTFSWVAPIQHRNSASTYLKWWYSGSFCKPWLDVSK
jgi:hypothetical protein